LTSIKSPNPISLCYDDRVSDPESGNEVSVHGAQRRHRSCGGIRGSSAEEPADPQAGFEYAQTYCATCHGISEEKSPLPQAPRFRHVADTTGMTATALQVWMQTSHPTMPNIIVAPSDMRNVIAYIPSLKAREGSTP
jgi:mono/diheme cytochrome c family protein